MLLTCMKHVKCVHNMTEARVLERPTISTLLDRIAHARRLVRSAKLENVSYTDFIALAPSRQNMSGGSERNKVGVKDVLQFCTPH